MRCNNCGRNTQNEEANFCEYCGSSFRESRLSPNPAAPREQNYTEASGNFQEVMAMKMSDKVMGQETSQAENIEKPITFLNWLGTYGILFVPLIGGLIFFVMLFVWAFSGATPASKKNWARVTLIFIAVAFIILITYLVTVVSSPMFQEMMSGSFDYNSFYNGLLQGTN